MTTLPDLRLKSKLYYYAAHVTSVYDGDTFAVEIDMGLGIWRKNQTIRLWKVNTPEITGGTRQDGLRVRDYVAGLILGQVILLRTILDKRRADRTEKYGRLLGEVLATGENGEVFNLNELLIEQGMAVPMDESGSLLRAMGRPGEEAPPLPETLRCPYCGEVRSVHAATAWVAQCPNCLDGPFQWRSSL